MEIIEVVFPKKWGIEWWFSLNFRSVFFFIPDELLVAVVFRLQFVDKKKDIYYFFSPRNELSVADERGRHTVACTSCIFCLTDVFFEWHPRKIEREQHHTWLISVIDIDICTERNARGKWTLKCVSYFWDLKISSPIEIFLQIGKWWEKNGYKVYFLLEVINL